MDEHFSGRDSYGANSSARKLILAYNQRKLEAEHEAKAIKERIRTSIIEARLGRTEETRQNEDEEIADATPKPTAT